MKILIIGATGLTGRQLLTQSLQAGHEVTVLVRSVDKIKITDAKLRIVKGDVLAPATVQAAVAGQDAVLSALGHKRFFIPTSIISKGTTNLINAMNLHGVKRFICITTLGINESRFRLGLYYTLFVIPFIVYFYFRDKALQERLIRQSNLQWTIVRPAQLTNGKLTGKYKHGEVLGNYIITNLISRANVAHFMLQQLEDKTYLKKAVAITNP